MFASYSYSYDISVGDVSDLSEIAGIGLGIILVSVLISIVFGLLISYVLTHKVYEKGGYPKWASIVPFYNTYVLYKMADVEIAFFFISLFIPLINIYLFIELAKKFGKSAAFGVLTFFFMPIGLAILGYGDAVFSGPRNPNTTDYQPTQPSGQPPVQPTPPATPAAPTATPQA